MEMAELSSFYVERQTCLSRLTLRFDWSKGQDKELPEVVMYEGG